MQRRSAESPYFCAAKPSEPTRKCESFYPLSALTAEKVTIEIGVDMNKRLQKYWTRLGCTVVDRLGGSRKIVKNGVTLVSGGYQAELNYLRINHSEVINGQAR